MKITKAVIPVAGLATRFLPQTKAMPKQMLPLVDKPVIQYIVENLVKAGIKDIILVTGYHQRAIEDHFDKPHQDLVKILVAGGEKKKKYLEEIQAISELANFIYVRQKGPYGNGTPLLNVRPLIGDEAFIYTWGDDMILSNPNEFIQLTKLFETYGCSILAGVKAQSDEDYNRYGFVGGRELEKGTIDVKTIIEKPGKAKTPGNLGTVSSFIFTHDIFDYLDQALDNLPKNQEFYYNDALNLMLKAGKRIIAYEVQNGKYVDTGNILGYIEAFTEFALRDNRVGPKYKNYLTSLLKTDFLHN